MVRLFKPIAIDFFSGSMCQSWCGCAELESVPPKDFEMESLVSASLHQIRLRPCVKGSCLFSASFSLSKGQMSRLRIVPRSLLSHIIYGYSTADGYSKSLGYTVDIRIQGSSLSAKWHFSGWVKTGASLETKYGEKCMRKYTKEDLVHKSSSFVWP